MCPETMDNIYVTFNFSEGKFFLIIIAPPIVDMGPTQRSGIFQTLYSTKANRVSVEAHIYISLSTNSHLQDDTLPLTKSCPEAKTSFVVVNKTSC